MLKMTRMAHFWHKFKAALEGSMRHQVTRAGLLFTLSIVVVAMAAFASANNLLFLILAAMLSTLLISGFISRLSLAGLEIDFVLPDHISARRKVHARILIRNDKKWMPSFSMHLAGTEQSQSETILYFPVIPGGATLEETIELYFARRGTHRENSFRISTRFPFGFIERRVEVVLRRDIVVYPCLDPQPGFDELLKSVTGDIEALTRGRGHDFYRIRPYEALESARHVDWKATAHTGSLQVREFAREQEHMVEIFLDLDVPLAAEEWFERAIDCCAYLAWGMAQRGARVCFRTQEFDVRLPEESDIYAILKYLALVTPAPGRPPSGPDAQNSYQVVFSANPERMTALGWGNGELRSARLLGPDAFPEHGSDRPAGS